MNYIYNILKKIEAYNKLGEIQTINGTKLIGKALHIAPKAWLHSVFPPINNDELLYCEESIGLKFPIEYIQFLKQCNGLNIFSNALSFYGFRKNYYRTSEEILQQPFDILTPNVHERIFDSEVTFLYIGVYKQDGSLLYIDAKNGNVHYCNRESSKSIYKWSSLKEAIVSEFDRISDLFDDNGKIKNPAVPTIPIG